MTLADEKRARFHVLYESERRLRAIALEEALAARKSGKRVPAKRRIGPEQRARWRSLRDVFERGKTPWWEPTKEEK